MLWGLRELDLSIEEGVALFRWYFVVFFVGVLDRWEEGGRRRRCGCGWSILRLRGFAAADRVRVYVCGEGALFRISGARESESVVGRE